MIKRLLKIIGVAAFWLAVWFAVARAVGLELLFPSPVSTAAALWELLKTPDFYRSVFFSLGRILRGYVLGVAAGVVLAVLTHRFAVLRALIAPLLSVIKATPVASFIILLFVWLSNGMVASVTASLIVLPIVWGALFTALGEVDPELLEMAAVLGVPKRRALARITVPSVLPAFKGAAATAMGLCWKAGIAAEVICHPQEPAIGVGLYNAKIYLETPSLFAWTLVVVLVSVLLEKLFVRLILRERRPRHET